MSDPIGDARRAKAAAPAAETPGILSDIGQTLLGVPRTAAEGLTGMGGNLFNVQSYIAGKVMSKLGYTPEQIAAKQAEWDKDRAWFLPDSAEVSPQFTELLTDAGVPQSIEEASRYQPQTRPGQVVQTAALLAPSLAVGGGNLPSNIASRVAAPTALIEGGAEIGKALGDETLGRLIGGFGSMAVPAAWNRFSAPHPAEPGRIDQARVLDKAKVPYTAGQKTGNEKLLYRESVAGNIPAKEAQGPAFTEASARTQGGFPPNTNTFSRPVMRTELDRMGAEFDRIAGISDAPLTPALQNNLLDAVVRYQEMPVIGTAVENTVNGIGRAAALNNGKISGAAYKDTNSKIGDIIRNTEDDALRSAMIEIKGHLDDAIQQSLPPAEQASWASVRQQYRDFLPIERAKAASSGTAARGVITPTALRTGIKAVEGPRELSAGSRPMTDLAEAGVSVIERVPQSGTAPRLMDKLAGVIPLAAGGGAASLGAALGLSNPVAGLLGTTAAGAAYAVPHIRDAYIRSDLGQWLAGRQGPRFPAGSGVGLPSAAVPTLQGIADPVPVAPAPAPDQQGALEPLTDDPLDQRRQVAGLPLPDMLARLVGGRIGRV